MSGLRLMEATWSLRLFTPMYPGGFSRGLSRSVTGSSTPTTVVDMIGPGKNIAIGRMKETGNTSSYLSLNHPMGRINLFKQIITFMVVQLFGAGMIWKKAAIGLTCTALC